jgi:O-antigen/teichoic acid export membrane protein
MASLPTPGLSQADTQDLVHKILSGTRWAAMLRLAAQGFSWISTIVVVRFISPHDYGLNTMLEAPMELMLLLSTLGLDIALVQSKKLEHDTLRSAFGWLLLINATLFFTYFLGAPLVAAYFNEPRLEALARTLAFVFLLAPFRVIPNAQLDRELKFKLKAQVELASTVVATMLTLVLAVLGAGVWALVVGVLANRVLQALILMIKHPWFVWPSFNPHVAKRLIAFGGLSAAGSAVALLSGKLVHFIAGPELGAAQLGLFALSMQFALLPLAKLMPVINQTLMPAFAKFQDQRELSVHYLERSLGVASLVLFPLMVGMACIADLFVATVLGARWSAATLPLALLSLIMPLRMVTLFLRPVMTGMGRPDLALVSSLTLLCTLPPLALFGVRYGVIGLVAAWLIAEPVVLAVTLRMSRRALPVKASGVARSILPAFASAGVMAAVVLGLRGAFALDDGFPALAAAIAVGATSYALALRLLFPQPLREAFRVIRGRRTTVNKTGAPR